MAQTLHILLVEDNPGDARLVEEILADIASPSFAVEHTSTLAQSLGRLKSNRFDCALIDLSLPDSAGIATIAAVRSAAPAVPVVVFTGADEETLIRSPVPSVTP
jgi:CheY-like chemotaxis protein